MNDLIVGVFIGFIALVMYAFFALLTAIVTMLLWNWLMPIIFGLPNITYWQAYGLQILIALLFSGTKSSSSSSSTSN